MTTILSSESLALPERTRRFREQYRPGHIGPSYSGKAHLAFTSVASLALAGVAFSGVRAPSAWEWLTVPLTFLFANLSEYVGHRWPMHRPFPGLLRALYRRHAQQHHRFYTHDAMSFESWRDVEMVLFPPLLILFFSGAFVLPVGGLVAAMTTANVARLFAGTVVSYFLLYEWLHFSYHMPPDTWVGRLAIVRRLRVHHTAHHDLRRMGHYHFNITFPIGDWLFGTLTSSAPRQRRARGWEGVLWKDEQPDEPWVSG